MRLNFTPVFQLYNYKLILFFIYSISYIARVISHQNYKKKQPIRLEKRILNVLIRTERESSLSESYINLYSRHYPLE